MALKARVTQEEYNGLDATIQAEYKPVSGDDEHSHELTVTKVGGVELADTSSLQTALQRERKAKREATAALEKVPEEIREHPDEAAEAIEFRKKFADVDPEKIGEGGSKEDLERLQTKYEGDIKKLKADHKRELESARGETQSVEGELGMERIRNAARSAISKEKGSAELLLPLIEREARTRRENGKLVIEVLGDDGEPRMSPSAGSTDLMTIAERIAEMKADTDRYGRAFDGVEASGSGAGAGSRSRASGNAHVISVADSKDVNKYRQARDAARKAGVPLQIAE